MAELVEFINNHLVLAFLLAGVAGLWMLYELRIKGKSISHTHAIQLLNKHQAIVVDIRSLDAFAARHIKGAHHLPEKTAVAEIPKFVKKYAGKDVILVSQMGNAPAVIVQALAKACQPVCLAGGMNTWTQEQLPVVSDAQEKQANKDVQRKTPKKTAPKK